ncbi:MAG TPA: hypothetical protein VFZ66_25560 [Herpetosiphonaceae bacterium]
MDRNQNTGSGESVSGTGLDSDMSGMTDTGSRDQSTMSGYDTGTVRGMDSATSGGTAMGNTGSTGAGMSTSRGGGTNTDLNVSGDDEDNTARKG